MEHTMLYYRQGGSDKQYQVTLEQRKDGYVVNTQYGRRGFTLQTGTKTPTAVNYGAAKGIYERLIQEKMAKGYTVGEDGTPYSGTEHVGRSTGMVPQLLNPIARDEIGALLRDPHWWIQQKHDGERRLIQKKGQEVTGINRRGLQVNLPQPWVEECLRCPTDLLIDGEAVGETLYVFDLLTTGEEDIREKPYLGRYLLLMGLLTTWGAMFTRLVKTVCTDGEKERYFEELEQNGAEGVVFERIEAPYTSGRPASGGPALKLKFVESASFVVHAHNAKRSVSLALLSQNSTVEVGSVTIPPNQPIPPIGSVVEVHYLYAFKDGCIYQPVYRGARPDIEQKECTLGQLKYKTVSEEIVA